MLLALALGSALGAMLMLPTAPGLGLAYGLMLLSQSYGQEIISTLHNATAAVEAAAPAANSDVSADTAFEQLCVAYEAHHYDWESNALHAAGMILVFGMLVVCAAGGKEYACRLLPWAPPTWYLFAWVGHFFYQADIPAVFTYGMSLRGWASGEACAVIALCKGHSFNEPRDLVLTAAIMIVWFACASNELHPRPATRPHGNANKSKLV
jgi:hypothetical protein